MAVLFPTPVGYTLRANRPSELLQGFLNIQNVEGVNTGQLTKANLNSYSQKQFFAPDPSSAVASYLNQNFTAIAKLDGNANSISADDLVQMRSKLPEPPPVTKPPTQKPPANNNNPQLVLMVLFQFIQYLLGNLFSPSSQA